MNLQVLCDGFFFFPDDGIKIVLILDISRCLRTRIALLTFSFTYSNSVFFIKELSQLISLFNKATKPLAQENTIA